MILSIIVAAYNVEEFIEKCIISCQRQNIPSESYEILVVNDGSTDNTLNILTKLKGTITNLKIIDQINLGLGASRNKGLLYSSGEYIWFIDGDDYLKDDCIKTILDKIEEQNLDVLVLNYAIVTEKYQIVKNNFNVVRTNQITISGGEFYESYFMKSYTWLFVFKKELFTIDNILFKDRINMQDSEILPRLMFYTERLSYLKEVCYFYVQQENSFTNTNDGQKRYNYFFSVIQIRKFLKDFLDESGYKNPLIASGIKNKIVSLDHLVFNHLVFYIYKKEWLEKILKLLKDNDFYPLKYKAKGKMKIIKWGLNNYPFTMKVIIDKFQSFRK